VAEMKGKGESEQRGSESRSMQQSQKGGGIIRRGEFFPSLFSLSPHDVFSMSPFQLMRRFSEEMDRMFSGRERVERGVWSPAVEIRQQGNNMIVSAELPGLNREDIKVEVTEDGVAISGERKHEEQREGYSERSYGRFYRLIPLPDEAKVDQAKASFNNGVLEITVPVPESERKRREIPVETGGEKTRTSGGGA
jgi:HSP20 family protein